VTSTFLAQRGRVLIVHREQGATADRTNYLAEGGGRELAYVAMSRARGPSIVHAVADDVGQAIEDITYDWSHDRRTTRAQRRVAELETDARFRRRWLAQHAELDRGIQHVQRELRHLDSPIGVELDARLKSVLLPRAGSGTQNVERA
jgi:hypothetical protein